MLFLRIGVSLNRDSTIIKKSYAHWDVNELYEVANKTHDCETDSYCFANLEEFYMQGMRI